MDASKLPYKSFVAILATVLCFAGQVHSADVVTKEGSPANYVPVPSLKVLQAELQQDKDLATQGKLGPSAILIDNVHGAKVTGAPTLLKTPLEENTLVPSTSFIHQISANQPISIIPSQNISTTQTSPAETNVTISDPTGLLTDAEKAALLSALSLFPQNQWQGVQTIYIQSSTQTVGIGATQNGLVLQLSPTDHDLYSDIYLLSVAVGYYYYEYNLDPKIKSEFKADDGGSAFPDSFHAAQFALDEGEYIDGAALGNAYSLVNDPNDASYLANALFLATLFLAPDQPASAYVYTLSDEGVLTRSTADAYILGHTIHYDGVTVYFNNQNQMTAAVFPGYIGLVSYLSDAVGATLTDVPAEVFQTFQHGPPRHDHGPPNRR